MENTRILKFTDKEIDWIKEKIERVIKTYNSDNAKEVRELIEGIQGSIVDAVLMLNCTDDQVNISAINTDRVVNNKAIDVAWDAGGLWAMNEFGCKTADDCKEYIKDDDIACEIYEKIFNFYEENENETMDETKEFVENLRRYSNANITAEGIIDYIYKGETDDEFLEYAGSIDAITELLKDVVSSANKIIHAHADYERSMYVTKEDQREIDQEIEEMKEDGLSLGQMIEAVSEKIHELQIPIDGFGNRSIEAEEFYGKLYRYLVQEAGLLKSLKRASSVGSTFKYKFKVDNEYEVQGIFDKLNNLISREEIILHEDPRFEGHDTISAITIEGRLTEKGMQEVTELKEEM
ncbi:hypothetical protein [Inediibacterium massiliense]|uniref:hypothetical protein n=1 Tax=Inediibacterium massiliense TaxID=1658111 RepID=UPI0006B5283D|nr:hypothetical protein [Inediibacterium massiliense]